MLTPLLNFDHGICAIDAGYQRLGLAAIYLLVERGRAALIDTGTVHSVPRILAALADQGIAPAQVDYVIPTHVHLDHAGAAGALLCECPNAQLVVHPRGARHLIDPAKLIAGVTAVYGAEEAVRSFGTLVPVAAKRVIEAPDQFALDLNGRVLQFLDTPGHARHHFCVWDARSRGMFTGDTFGLSYRELDTAHGAFILPTTTPVQFDPVAWHGSLDRLLAFQPQQLFLTHFGRVTEIVRLAHDLHELIDAFAALAQQHRDAGSARHARLIAGQRALLLPRLRAHGCELGDGEIDALLGMDYSLNAQGLEVWLDRDRDS